MDKYDLKRYIQEKQYKKSVNCLEKLIINYVVKLIKEKQEDFEYTTMFDLVDASEKYIDNKDKDIAKNIRIYSKEMDDIDNLIRLLSLCEYYKINLEV